MRSGGGGDGAFALASSSANKSLPSFGAAALASRNSHNNNHGAGQYHRLFYKQPQQQPQHLCPGDSAEPNCSTAGGGLLVPSLSSTVSYVLSDTNGSRMGCGGAPSNTHQLASLPPASRTSLASTILSSNSNRNFERLLSRRVSVPPQGGRALKSTAGSCRSTSGQQLSSMAGASAGRGYLTTSGNNTGCFPAIYSSHQQNTQSRQQQQQQQQYHHHHQSVAHHQNAIQQQPRQNQQQQQQQHQQTAHPPLSAMLLVQSQQSSGVTHRQHMHNAPQSNSSHYYQHHGQPQAPQQQQNPPQTGRCHARVVHQQPPQHRRLDNTGDAILYGNSISFNAPSSAAAAAAAAAASIVNSCGNGTVSSWGAQGGSLSCEGTATNAGQNAQCQNRLPNQLDALLPHYKNRLLLLLQQQQQQQMSRQQSQSRLPQLSHRLLQPTQPSEHQTALQGSRSDPQTSAQLVSSQQPSSQQRCSPERTQLSDWKSTCFKGVGCSTVKGSRSTLTEALGSSIMERQLDVPTNDMPLFCSSGTGDTLVDGLEPMWRPSLGGGDHAAQGNSTGGPGGGAPSCAREHASNSSSTSPPSVRGLDGSANGAPTHSRSGCYGGTGSQFLGPDDHWMLAESLMTASPRGGVRSQRWDGTGTVTGTTTAGSGAASSGPGNASPGPSSCSAPLPSRQHIGIPQARRRSCSTSGAATESFAISGIEGSEPPPTVAQLGAATSYHNEDDWALQLLLLTGSSAENGGPVPSSGSPDPRLPLNAAAEGSRADAAANSPAPLRSTSKPLSLDAGAATPGAVPLDWSFSERPVPQRAAPTGIERSPVKAADQYNCNASYASNTPTSWCFPRCLISRLENLIRRLQNSLAPAVTALPWLNVLLTLHCLVTDAVLPLSSDVAPCNEPPKSLAFRSFVSPPPLQQWRLPSAMHAAADDPFSTQRSFAVETTTRSPSPRRRKQAVPSYLKNSQQYNATGCCCGCKCCEGANRGGSRCIWVSADRDLSWAVAELRKSLEPVKEMPDLFSGRELTRQVLACLKLTDVELESLLLEPNEVNVVVSITSTPLFLQFCRGVLRHYNNISETQMMELLNTFRKWYLLAAVDALVLRDLKSQDSGGGCRSLHSCYTEPQLDAQRHRPEFEWSTNRSTDQRLTLVSSYYNFCYEQQQRKFALCLPMTMDNFARGEIDCVGALALSFSDRSKIDARPRTSPWAIEGCTDAPTKPAELPYNRLSFTGAPSAASLDEEQVWSLVQQISVNLETLSYQLLRPTVFALLDGNIPDNVIATQPPIREAQAKRDLIAAYLVNLASLESKPREEVIKSTLYHSNLAGAQLFALRQWSLDNGSCGSLHTSGDGKRDSQLLGNWFDRWTTGDDRARFAGPSRHRPLDRTVAGHQHNKDYELSSDFRDCSNTAEDHADSRRGSATPLDGSHPVAAPCNRDEFFANRDEDETANEVSEPLESEGYCEKHSNDSALKHTEEDDHGGGTLCYANNSDASVENSRLDDRGVFACSEAPAGVSTAASDCARVPETAELGLEVATCGSSHVGTEGKGTDHGTVDSIMSFAPTSRRDNPGDRLEPPARKQDEVAAAPPGFWIGCCCCCCCCCSKCGTPAAASGFDETDDDMDVNISLELDASRFHISRYLRFSTYRNLLVYTLGSSCDRFQERSGAGGTGTRASRTGQVYCPDAVAVTAISRQRLELLDTEVLKAFLAGLYVDCLEGCLSIVDRGFRDIHQFLFLAHIRYLTTSLRDAKLGVPADIYDSNLLCGHVNTAPASTDTCDKALSPCRDSESCHSSMRLPHESDGTLINGVTIGGSSENGLDQSQRDTANDSETTVGGLRLRRVPQGRMGRVGAAVVSATAVTRGAPTLPIGGAKFELPLSGSPSNGRRADLVPKDKSFGSAGSSTVGGRGAAKRQSTPLPAEVQPIVKRPRGRPRLRPLEPVAQLATTDAAAAAAVLLPSNGSSDIKLTGATLISRNAAAQLTPSSPAPSLRGSASSRGARGGGPALATRHAAVPTGETVTAGLSTTTARALRSQRGCVRRRSLRSLAAEPRHHRRVGVPATAGLVNRRGRRPRNGGINNCGGSPPRASRPSLPRPSKSTSSGALVAEEAANSVSSDLSDHSQGRRSSSSRGSDNGTTSSDEQGESSSGASPAYLSGDEGALTSGGEVGAGTSDQRADASRIAKSKGTSAAQSEWKKSLAGGTAPTRGSSSSRRRNNLETPTATTENQDISRGALSPSDVVGSSGGGAETKSENSGAGAGPGTSRSRSTSSNSTSQSPVAPEAAASRSPDAEDVGAAVTST